MTAVLLSPHNDDETLFAAYSCLMHQPRVVVCLYPDLQERRGGPPASVRIAETEAAMAILGCLWTQWAFSEAETVPYNTLEIWMRELRESYDTVIAPAIENGGHAHHNLIGSLALEVWGGSNIYPYTTYRRGFGRTVGERPIEPLPEWIAKKHEALACYRSQIALPDTRPWFTEALDEWYA